MINAQLISMARGLWERSDGETIDLGSVRIVEHKADEAREGSEGDISLIVEVSGQLYRIDGYQDSYAENPIFTSARQVKATTKTVTVYE